MQEVTQRSPGSTFDPKRACFSAQHFAACLHVLFIKAVFELAFFEAEAFNHLLPVLLRSSRVFFNFRYVDACIAIDAHIGFHTVPVFLPGFF